MTRLRIRTVREAQPPSASGRREPPRPGYTPVAARYNPHYDRWPSLPPHLPRSSR